MTTFQKVLKISAARPGLKEISRDVAEVAASSGIKQGLCHIFLQHTSASLALMENADPTARDDLENYMERLVPAGAGYFRHTAEGPDDMPSHIKSVLTSATLSVPIQNGRLGLGTWQGIFLWEHRNHPSTRKIIITIV